MKIFLIGYPLSGKSTIGKKIAQKMQCNFLSTGEYARSLGMGLEDSIKTRDFSVAYNDMIEEKVQSLLKDRDCVIDGYPRSIAQLSQVIPIQDRRVVYCYANPVVIADRRRKRALEKNRGEDTDEIVASRIRASLALKETFEQYIDLEMLDTGSAEEMKRFWDTI